MQLKKKSKFNLTSKFERNADFDSPFISMRQYYLIFLFATFISSDSRLPDSNSNNGKSNLHQPIPGSAEVIAAQRIFTLKNFANRQPFEQPKANKQQR